MTRSPSAYEIIVHKCSDHLSMAFKMQLLTNRQTSLFQPKTLNALLYPLHPDCAVTFTPTSIINAILEDSV